MYPLRRQVDLHRCQACTMQRLNFLKSAEHVTDGLDPSLLLATISSYQPNKSNGCLQTSCIPHVKKKIVITMVASNKRLLLLSSLTCAEHGEILGGILGGRFATTSTFQRSTLVESHAHGLPTYLLTLIYISILVASSHHITSQYFSFTNSPLSTTTYYNSVTLYWISLLDFSYGSAGRLI
jgi:hypothetical protein